MTTATIDTIETSADTKTLTILRYIVEGLVDEPGDVAIVASRGDDATITFHVMVNPRDVGKVIGKQGRTARSIRLILCAVAQRDKASYALDIVEARE